ncbi:MAG: 16S rRNA (guanine(527)-N(7))-methyltransferase RsmG [Acidobacteriota bacterium]
MADDALIFRETLGEAPRWGFELSATQIDGCLQFYKLLVEWNQKLDLTSVTEPDRLARRHFLESFFAATHVPSGTRKLMDIGSGAGFPGIPTKILRPEIEVTLVEPRARRAAFLRAVASELRVPGLGVVGADLEQILSGGASLEGVALRGLRLKPSILRKLWTSVEAGGFLLYLGGQKDSEFFERIAPGERYEMPEQPGRCVHLVIKSV